MHIGSIIPQLGFLDPIIQDDTLVRMYEDALYPELLYRMEAMPKRWEAQTGDTQVFTRSGLFGVDTTPLVPGVDPIPENEAYEQWKVIARQQGKTTDVNMPTSRTALNNLFANKVKLIGLNAGQTMNRIARNALFLNYSTGHTIAETAGAPTTTFEVASITGFSEQVTATGSLLPVGIGNEKVFSINGTAQGPRIIGALPLDANFPHGRGTITVEAPGVTIVAGDAVEASDAPTVIRSGGGLSVDALSATDILTFRDIQRAIATMRRNRVPKHADGFYHCHLDPLAEAQVFQDNEFQRANETNYGDAPYQEFAIGKVLGTIFYSNSESPSQLNAGLLQPSRPVSAAGARLSKEIGAEVVNSSGVSILRTVISGGGALYEQYIDESEYLSSAGVQGKVGAFQQVSNNGIAIMLDRIRMILRAPQDRLQQVVSQTWSWSGDFGVPSDFRGGLTSARFKRSVVIESGQDF